MRHFIPTATAIMALQNTKTLSAITSTTTATSTTTQDKTNTSTQLTTSSTQMTTITTSNGISINTDQSKVTASKTDLVPYCSVYERARGTHLLEEKLRRSPMVGQRGSLERSTGSPHTGRGSVDKSGGSPKLRQGSLERSVGSPFLGRDSPLISSRASSPHTLVGSSPRPATRSTSELTRSQMGSPRMDYRHSPRPSPHSPKIKLRYHWLCAPRKEMFS